MAMRLVLFLTAYILSVAISHAQSNFFIRYPTSNLRYGWAVSCRTIGNTISAFGAYTQVDSFYQSGKIFISLENTDGNTHKVLKTDSWGVDTTFVCGFPPTTSCVVGRYIFAVGQKIYLPDKYVASVFRFDTVDNESIRLDIETDSVTGFKGIAQGIDGFLYAYGFMSDTFDEKSDYYLVKLDTGLKKVWDIKWGGINSDLPYTIHPSKDSSVILTSISGISFSYTTYISKVSKDGQLVYSKPVPSLGAGSSQMFDFNAQDGTCLIRGAQLAMETPYISINRLDSNLNIVWSRSYQSYIAGNYLYDIWNGMRVKDGYVIVGNRNNAIWGWVHKLDFNGNKVWETTYKSQPIGTLPPFSIIYMTGIDTLPNGGYVLSGSTDSAGYQVAFIMTIDSNGCFSNTACEATYFSDIEYFEPAIAVNVYPNPANEQINFTFTNLQLNQCQLRISNSLGQVVHQSKVEGQQTTLNTSTLATGLYFWALQQEGRVIKSGKFIKQ